MELNSPLKTSTKKCISQGGVHLQLGHHQMCPRLTNPEHGQPDGLLQLTAALRLCTLLTAAPRPWQWKLWPSVVISGDNQIRVTCPTGARYFLEGMRSGKVEWANVAQSHREGSRTSSLSQLGSNNFIKIFSGAQSKFFLPSTAAVRLSVRTGWERADSEMKRSPGFHSTRVRGLRLARIHARGNGWRVIQKQEQGLCKSSSFPSREISVNTFSHRKLGGWWNPLTCTEVLIWTASQLFSALPTATFHPGLCCTKPSWAN